VAQTTVMHAEDVGDGLRIGRVLSRSFEIMFRHFLLFCLLTGIPALPYVLMQPRSSSATPDASGVVLILAALLFGVVAQAMVLYGTFQDMRGKPFGFAESLKKGLARFFPIIGLAVCEAVAVMFSGILLIFPAFIVMTMFYVAVPACVVEKAGPIDSLKRSAELTKGHRWKVFGLALLIGLVGIVVSVVLGGVFGLVGSPLVLSVVSLLWQAIFGAFSAIAVAVLYHDLRASREGIDADKMAAVFD